MTQKKLSRVKEDLRALKTYLRAIEQSIDNASAAEDVEEAKKIAKDVSRDAYGLSSAARDVLEGL